MLKELDLKGLICPKPVIMTKKELESSDCKTLIVTVDNTFAKENILKLCKSLYLSTEILKEKENEITIKIIKEENFKEENSKEKKENNIENKCRMISNDKLGQGSEELGNVLIKGFIYTLTELNTFPKYIILLNSGVKLSTQNSDTVENLKILEENGVEIMSCGTCLDYYGLKESLKVGSVTNMYNIVEILKSVENNITL